MDVFHLCSSVLGESFCYLFDYVTPTENFQISYRKKKKKKKKKLACTIFIVNFR